MTAIDTPVSVGAHDAPTTTVAGVRDLSLRIPTTLDGRSAWVHAAERVTLGLQAGTLHALVGESGSGKSILASSMLGTLPLGTRSRGTVEVNGGDMTTASEEQWRRVRGRVVALAGQSAATGLTPTRTVGAQLAETIREVSNDPALRIRGRRGNMARAQRAAELLDLVGLAPGALAQYPHELSGGMAQRAVLAFSMAGDPRVLLADEPTAGLDPELADRILRLLADIAARGTAVLVITHDLSSLTRTDIAQTVSVMYAGRIVESGPAERILRAPSHEYTRALLRALPENGLHRMGTPPPSLTHLEIRSASHAVNTAHAGAA